MLSHTTTTAPCPSPEQQQISASKFATIAFNTPDAPSGSFVYNNPSDRSNSAVFVSPKSTSQKNSYYQSELLQKMHRRGSLPLKKRRVYMLQEDPLYPMTFHRVDGTGFRTIDSLLDQSKVADDGHKATSLQQSSYDCYRWNHDLQKRNSMNASPFDKMNTLSLIAAAAAVDEASRSSQYTFHPSTSHFASTLSSFNRVDPMRNTNESFATPCHGDSVDDSCTSSRTDSRTSISSDDISGSKSQQDFNNLTFTASRNGRATPLSSKKEMKSPIGEASLQECPSWCSIGQDKRYTGLSPCQVRCNATTTRGRPCTYTAVKSTKYCFLHADYATNPPPRRKSSKDEDMEISSPSSVSPAAMLNSEDDLSEDEVEDQVNAFSAPSTELTTNKESTNTSASKPFKKRRTNAKFAEKHAESSRPLLSMMATDQWFGQSVQIAVGPFEGHIGVVQKWGNGWITVLIEGVGFHNRRSFELYLDTTDEHGDKEKNVQKSKPGRKKTDKSRIRMKDHDRQLFHCVSRDVVSPSPTANVTETSKRRISNGYDKKSRAATPKPTTALNSQNKKTLPKSKKIVVVATNFAEIPETPQPRCISDGAESPAPVKSSTLEETSNMKTLSLPTPEVTPFPEKTTTVSHLLSLQNRSNDAFEFPSHSDDETTKQSTGITSSDSVLVFRPSMGERTRGRSSNLAGCRNVSQSSDSTDSTQTYTKKRNSDDVSNPTDSPTIYERDHNEK